MASQTVENYIKAIFQLTEKEGNSVTTSALADHLTTSAASVTDMLKKLADQKLIEYIKYKGVRLSTSGKSMAVQLIRKHRLWETFLFEKLTISWDGVHEIAEQLEHVHSDRLIEQLDEFLGFPKFDPHGDPIPDASGKFTLRNQVLLSSLEVGDDAQVVAVREHDADFLQYLHSRQLNIHSKIKVVDKLAYDETIKVRTHDGLDTLLSAKASQNLYVKKIN
ncbi:MAG: metal-dependent transcriptional regulator [Saprospiraceae bacterium]|jgi:DtxR family Mn-dependent transcriptional regulator|nr:metal-dependent transcriptional regulator [Saprospiraceae bacterium]MBK6480362.1 metal-dependent transcriptional regulator [Saprospiraceae bacterium]MBK6814781.1 metal-dependent transcriptional regulator [Saprospiraceae bacterium]MBK7435712.1 metal-dependent transcriptional regulator [Saprospiraceae bacterium]MBK7606366.1 metal-dependent transcriptional regulator [Saprospiraceae bacterium]